MRSPLFRWRAATERDERDMVFFDDADKPVGYGEIEGWWSSDGEKEIHGIQHDLTVKLGILRIPSVMLILTSHGRDAAEGNIHWLAERLGVAPAALCKAVNPRRHDLRVFLLIRLAPSGN